jgi:two-component system NtrC family sensor kinase
MTTRDPTADSSDSALSYAELEREKERFRELSDAAFEGLAIHDATIIVDCNQALAKMFGYEVSELIGASTVPLGAPETRELVKEKILSDSREPYEAIGLRKDGTKFAAEIRGAPIHYQGRMLRMTAIRDISEQKKLEAQFRLSEQMVSMGSVAAGVAHEINNPLTYVLGNLQILGRHLASLEPELGKARVETLKKCIDEALDGTERVRAIVRDLRGFTRPTDQEQTAVDLRQVLESSVRIVGNEVRHKARLMRDYQDLPLIDANELRLAQVFVNLLVNAAQAMEEGAAAQNEIRLHTGTDARGWAVVEIRDTGRGIPADLRERVFEPFFTTKPGRGTGLGLSISRTIVDDLGGEIQIGNAERGTVFRLGFPPARRAAVTTPPPQVVVAAAARSVLIVDDEPRVGQMLKRLLDRDYTVTSVTNIAEALKLVGEGRTYDAILCDLMMPEGTGMDLHARLRQVAPALSQRMIFVTGGAFTAAAEEFLKRPEIRHLEKPLTFDQLRQALESLRA